MSSTLEASALSAFRRAFGAVPAVAARAPARVELLGNHTDYNGGLVLAAAIDRFTVVAGRPVAGGEARVVSANLDGVETFGIGSEDRGEPGSWGRYVRGVAWALREAHGRAGEGFEALIAGDVPLGAGLSSSASLQAATALFLVGAGLVPNLASHLDDPARMELARTLRRSENEFVGVASGLLDQFSVLFGRADHVLMLDCRSLDYERLPLGRPAPAIIVCDSKTSRRLADGMYDRRVAECLRVVDHFRDRRGTEAVRSLRDVSLAELTRDWGDLDPTGRRRARHILTENDRVVRGASALRAGDVVTFGALMSTSHVSSRDDFENSSPALDHLIAAAEEAPGFLGGKLSGAGWAGCTVNLVESGSAEAFADAVRTGYASRAGIVPDVHVCHAAEGAAWLRDFG